MQNRNHVGIPGHDPGMQEWIPMHRVLLTQPPVERIRIGKHGRIQQLAQTQTRVHYVSLTVEFSSASIRAFIGGVMRIRSRFSSTYGVLVPNGVCAMV